MLGDDYIVQHCLYKLQEEMKMRRLQNYIADSLYAISNHRAITMRFCDFEKSLDKPTEERSGEQIKNQIMNKWNSAGRSDET